MMHLGVALSPFGHHPAAWREQGATQRSLDFGNFAAQARKAQDGALDFVFLADAQARRPQTELPPQTVPFEPTMLVAALATLSKRIGFVATAASTQHELYNLARRFASLDLISRGRVGWNLIASGPTPAWNSEYVEVVSRLWDSWDDDAFVYDKTAGRFFVPQKMHVLDHRGEHFTVRGPLNVNPSPQGKPIIAQTLAPETVAIAVHRADVLFVTDASPQEEGGALVAEARRLLDIQGRKRSDVRVLANIIPWIGATRAQALDRFEELNARSLPGSAETPQGRDVIGTAADVADSLQQSFERGEFDGFTILPPIAPSGFDAFVDLVVPELRRRGVFRAQYEGSTLRDHLALDRPRQPVMI
jgi:alkanesulfonate monooxygenase SsuD/methylene tetrahydromethanopterin reductase-like flavin-dependent oxidoreductase (luciferase family)